MRLSPAFAELADAARSSVACSAATSVQIVRAPGPRGTVVFRADPGCSLFSILIFELFVDAH